jgi:hypothetical protein
MYFHPQVFVYVQFEVVFLLCIYMHRYGFFLKTTSDRNSKKHPARHVSGPVPRAAFPQTQLPSVPSQIVLVFHGVVCQRLCVHLFFPARSVAVGRCGWSIQWVCGPLLILWWLWFGAVLPVGSGHSHQLSPRLLLSRNRCHCPVTLPRKYILFQLSCRALTLRAWTSVASGVLAVLLPI